MCEGLRGDCGGRGACLSEADVGCCSLELSWEKVDSAALVLPSPKIQGSKQNHAHQYKTRAIYVILHACHIDNVEPMTRMINFF